ncbi:Brp/Blh family beta-carotene 15,15'-dioxygenase [Cyclobacterium plantarum]|uniref:Probable beta-carotene 15,15'-dioxygenase n=1 Tax=Cyclobacterium plantarum TaxID=2716263 RepID=A0ABX0H416_9BACT|nr:Brp/Blh family beta-carotene 15,15'-dioxygenase [Cyclobacterium plantarum]NHE56364.1 beta-carotene 15,15'-dioxygenase, Brp/Blh family [Cyclobacterium plantarum]
MKSIENSSKILALILATSMSFIPGDFEFYHYLWFAIVMGLVGIPHGAVDHILFQKTSGTKPQLSFFLKYLTIGLIYLLTWIFLPQFSLFIFLLISMYHFGQGHWIGKPKNNLATPFYLIVGGFYLSIILSGDFAATKVVLAPILTLNEIPDFPLWLIPVLLWVTAWILDQTCNKSNGPLLFEMIWLGIFLYQLPLIVSFTTYFGFWHSLPNLLNIYKDIRKENPKADYSVFIPFSFLSLFGIGIILLVSHTWFTTAQLTLLFFVLVSLISAPHIWIMEKFFQRQKMQRAIKSQEV